MKANLLNFSESNEFALPLTGRLSVTIDLYAGTFHQMDIDNRTKGVLDCLEGSIYTNDNQIDELIVRRKAIDKQNPRCVVRICKIMEE